MDKRTVPLIGLMLFVILAGTLLTACGASTTPVASISNAGPADGQTLMQTRCTECHSLNRVTTAHLTVSQWQTTVDRMIRKGAQLSSQEEQVLIPYLAENYP